MKERKKAQDVFNDTDFVFSQKTTFEKAFPGIESIRVDVNETGEIRFGGNRTYTNSSLGEFVNCSNSMCYNGGFRIGDVVREMNYKREENREGSAICQGNEGSPKGRRIYRKCLNHFDYKITIKYKDVVEDKQKDDE